MLFSATTEGTPDPLGTPAGGGARGASSSESTGTARASPAPRLPPAAARASGAPKGRFDPRKIEYEVRHCEASGRCWIVVACSLEGDRFVLMIDLEPQAQTLELRVRQCGACVGPSGRVAQCNDPMGRFARDGVEVMRSTGLLHFGRHGMPALNSESLLAAERGAA